MKSCLQCLRLGDWRVPENTKRHFGLPITNHRQLNKLPAFSQTMSHLVGEKNPTTHRSCIVFSGTPAGVGVARALRGSQHETLRVFGYAPEAPKAMQVYPGDARPESGDQFVSLGTGWPVPAPGGTPGGYSSSSGMVSSCSASSSKGGSSSGGNSAPAGTGSAAAKVMTSSAARRGALRSFRFER